MCLLLPASGPAAGCLVVCVCWRGGGSSGGDGGVGGDGGDGGGSGGGIGGVDGGDAAVGDGGGMFQWLAYRALVEGGGALPVSRRSGLGTLAPEMHLCCYTSATCNCRDVVY